jgi:hypothetical protein
MTYGVWLAGMPVWASVANRLLMPGAALASVLSAGAPHFNGFVFYLEETRCFMWLLRMRVYESSG